MKEPLVLEPLFPDRSTGEPLAVQLARRLREAIESGLLPRRTRLLGSRQLCKQLGLGRNTVALAFEQLTAEGYLETRPGAGTFVAAEATPRAPGHKESAPQIPSSPAKAGAALRRYFEIAAARGPLRPGMPDLARFPLRLWNSHARAAVDDLKNTLSYTPAYGLAALREAIANHVRQFRGVSAHAEQIVIVEGAQAAMHLAAIVLAAPGESIAIEDPCYALARAAFEARQLKPLAVPVDEHGIVIEKLPPAARFAFVTPTHQFPLGGTLPLVRRMALLAWATHCNAYVIEDDYDSEFNSKTRPLPALQSLDHGERVIYIGSFSKTLAPGLRLGYLIVPPHLLGAFRAVRASTSLGVSNHLQTTAASFIAEGHLARHIRRMNAVYERRRAILTGALGALVDCGFSLGPHQTGLHVALTAPDGFDDAKFAHSHNMQYLALSTLCIERRDCRGFIFGFTNGTDTEIERAAGVVVRELSQ